MHGSKLNQEATIRYSQSFSSIILDDFFSENAGINGQQIISVTPVKQVNFFVLKVLFEQWQEETKKFKSPFFNYKNPEVNGALKNLVNTLSKNILIEKEDFRPLLEAAVSEALSLLFEPENYYLVQADHLAKNKDIRSVSKYIRVYKPLFDQIALEAEKNAEKELKEVITGVMNETQIDTEEQLKVIASFESVLALDVLDEIHEEIEPDEPDEEESTIQEFSASEAFGTSPSENINGHLSPLDEDLKQEFTPLTDDDDDDIVVAGKSLNDQFGHEDLQTLNQKYGKQDSHKSVATKLEEQTVSALATSININQRYMFLSDLFDGDEAEYIKALDTVDSCETFDDAVEFLVQNYAKPNSWEMNSDEVKEFLKVIFKRFR